jgi:hypothetical protein
MKPYFTIIVLVTTYFGIAQQLPNSLTVAVNTIKIEQGLKPTISPTLSYYAKNYTEVFGKYNYTSDPLDFGDRNIYVQSDTRLYNNLNNRFQMDMPLAGIDVNNGFYNYSFVEFTAAVLSTWGADNLKFVFNKQ